MKILRNMPISRRLWIVLLLAMTMLLLLGLTMLRQIYIEDYAAKEQKTRQVVEVTMNILEHYHGLEKTGALSREEAQKQAIVMVRKLRYDGDNYLWINDLGPKMLMHPTNAKLDGQDLSGFKDPDGKALFMDMVAVAKSKGGGFVDYRWPKPGASEPVGKVSYVQLFQPWAWVLGSGAYTDDVQAAFRAQMWKAAAVFLGIGLLLGGLIILISKSITRPLSDAVRAMADIAGGDGDLTRQLDARGQDELTALAGHFNGFTGKLRGVIEQSLQAANALNQASASLNAIATESQGHSVQQSQQMERVAAAIDEVTYGVQDVAKNAEQAAGEVRDADERARLGQSSIDNCSRQIEQLSGTIEQAVAVIQTLSQESTQIGRVLEVIRAIAEQTNLLALNAAIEAARAGEQGRGFAVVADEVRMLAQRTQLSTTEIQGMIETLQRNSDAAVKVIDESRQGSQLTIEQANLASRSLDQIGHSLRNLTGLNASIASAISQQSQAVEDINRNVTQATGLAQENAQAGERTSAASQNLRQLAGHLNRLLGQFRV
ncbi:methyl-accepting chemotaxis sensory transducer with Cache sensor [Pseudomonas sp. SJZ085]|nr:MULTISPECIES: methyl-accepting chemotaxis protein [unclassified Pseudomonas]TWC18473.1 methyl-accepting chemotaxis sensory transducer with Cache sensor [Pseudomonas sp. SJZ075]TWC23478.1 methyl-accepting chemotaxis sensory transducer with Cache sensor [Pseudomonas sp. SJZ074]TWC34756.1 methyl-accepting chemotaxis sensory transducer with Cache sensor [Pseudomonas sp. SJZ078]TWC40575.1 methyl-accepting chemotaxis sensory transducer with Cache sensor [Pseudomonas sp. SJZ085]TWC55498.1 methyl-a